LGSVLFEFLPIIDAPEANIEEEIKKSGGASFENCLASLKVMGVDGAGRFPLKKPELRLGLIVKESVPSEENSTRMFSLSDSVAVTIAIRAIMPIPIIPTVRVVRRACPRMEPIATFICSIKTERVNLMPRMYYRIFAL